MTKPSNINETSPDRIMIFKKDITKEEVKTITSMLERWEMDYIIEWYSLFEYLYGAELNTNYLESQPVVINSLLNTVDATDNQKLKESIHKFINSLECINGFICKIMKHDNIFSDIGSFLFTLCEADKVFTSNNAQ